MKNLLFAISIMVLFPFFVEAQDFPKVDKSSADYAYFPPRAAKRGFSHSEKEKAELMPRIRLLYSRPAMKGRKVFGKLVKYEKVWRVGANEATEIHFFVDVKVGETKVTSGRYTLYAIPNKDEWEIIINRDNDQWGSYNYDEKKDVCRVKVKTQNLSSSVENLSAKFSDEESGVTKLMIAWDTTMVSLPIAILK